MPVFLHACTDSGNQAMKCFRSPEVKLNTEQRASVKHIYDGRDVFV